MIHCILHCSWGRAGPGNVGTQGEISDWLPVNDDGLHKWLTYASLQIIGLIFDRLYYINISLIWFNIDFQCVFWPETDNLINMGAERRRTAFHGASASGVSPGLEDDGVTLLHWLTLHVSLHDKSASCGALWAHPHLDKQMY